MKRQPIRSTSLQAVGYDAEAQILEIEYRHGGVVRYTGVSAVVYQSLLAVPGKAQFVAQVLENSGYGRQQVK